MGESGFEDLKDVFKPFQYASTAFGYYRFQSFTETD